MRSSSSLIPLFCVVLAACAHRVRPVITDSGCQTLPLVGGASHVEVIPARIRDSSLISRSEAGLFVIVQWSSDSLARESRPVGAVVELFRSDTSIRVTKMLDSSSVLQAVVPSEGGVRLRVRRLAAWRVDTSLVIRRGFIDTARVYLQYGGLELCY